MIRSYVPPSRDARAHSSPRRNRRQPGTQGMQHVVDTIKRVIFVLFFLFLLSSLTRNIFEYWKNVSFHNTIYSQYQDVKEQNLALKTYIQKGKDDKEIEKTIRNKLNLLKEGEEVVIVAVPTPHVVVTPTPEPAYKQWKHIFFNQMK